MIKVQRVRADKQHQDFDIYESSIERDNTKLAARIDPNFFGSLALTGSVQAPVFGLLESEDVSDLLELVKTAAYDRWHLPLDIKFEFSYDNLSGVLKGTVIYGKNG